jgi:hypothetical protein
MKLRAVTRGTARSRDLILVGLKLWLLVHFLCILINLVWSAEVLFILLYLSFAIMVMLVLLNFTGPLRRSC